MEISNITFTGSRRFIVSKSTSGQSEILSEKLEEVLAGSVEWNEQLRDIINYVQSSFDKRHVEGRLQNDRLSRVRSSAFSIGNTVFSKKRNELNL